MSLSSDLISQFVKATKDDTKDKKESTVYGTTVNYNGSIYVKIDGSDRLTPVDTTAEVEPGERVTILIKDHTATITGNVSSPAARTESVQKIDSKISEFEIIMAYKVSTENLEAINATIESLKATTAKFNDMEAVNADIENLQSKYASLTYVSADDVEALNADIENLKAKFGEFTDISAEDLKAINADIDNLSAYNADFTYVSADILQALKASIKELKVDKLSAKEAEIKYANVDFSNIDQAAITNLFTDAGIIKDLIVSEGHITGELVGVTIKGDIIEGGTIKADKLVVKGSDGLFYKLNTDGVTTTAEQTKYNSLNGSVITAKSVTAEKVNVDDLVAFDATIGGFNITKSAIYSGVKESVDNTTRGIYMDKEGQLAIGDANSFLKYYKDEIGNYKLEISAKSIKMTSSNKTVEAAMNEMITKSVEQFYQSTSPASLSGGLWSTIQPTWIDGTYIWRRTVVTYGDGRSEYVPSETGVCITGNTGEKGNDAVLLQVLSSNGNMFKNSALSTTLTVEIIVGGLRITSSRDMYLYFGGTAQIEWQQKKFGETSFTPVDSDDPRISDNGFIFTINTEDVKLQTVFNCILNY